MKQQLLIIFILLGFSANALSQTGSILVNVKGFENSKGQVFFRVYNSPEGFPRKSENACRTMKKDIRSGECQMLITNLPPGEYAVVVFHDENKNGKLDTNWIGIPREALGLSNYPELSKPDFDKAKLFVPVNGERKISIKVDKIF